MSLVMNRNYSLIAALVFYALLCFAQGANFFYMHAKSAVSWSVMFFLIALFLGLKTRKILTYFLFGLLAFCLFADVYITMQLYWFIDRLNIPLSKTALPERTIGTLLFEGAAFYIGICFGKILHPILDSRRAAATDSPLEVLP